MIHIIQKFLKCNSYLNLILIITLLTICFSSCDKEPRKEQDTKLNQREGPLGPCEGGPYGNCTNQYTQVSKIIELPDYPGCMFTVSYRVRTCGNNIDIIFDGFDDSSIDPNYPFICPQWQQDFATIIANGNPLSFDLFLDNMENKLGKALGIALGSDINNPPPPCGSPNPHKTVSFISGSCNYSCTYIDYEPPYYGKRRTFTIVCGELCCQMNYEVCSLPNGAVTLVKIGSTVPSGQCQPSSYGRPCPPNTIYTSSCREKCKFDF